MTTASKFYLPQLDGLRFFAFFFVFIHHFPPATLYLNEHTITYWLASKTKDFGWIGVDIFLCLSSFLLSSLLIMEHNQTGTLSIKQFFIRRALRIWPLYYLIMFLAFCVFPYINLFAPAFKTPGYHLYISQHLFPFAIFLGNFSYAFFTGTLTTAIAPLWTVSLEEQFYVFWPILLFILLPRDKKWFFIALAGIVILSICVRLYIIKNAIPYPTVWVFTLARLDPFALGASLSYLYLNPKFQPRPLFALCAALILFLAVVSSTRIGLPNSVWQLFAVDLAACLLIYASLYSRKLKKVLSFKALAYLGKISFGLYVFHDIIIQFMNYESINHWPATSLTVWMGIFVLSLLLTIVCATISYYGFEKHFLKLKNRFTVIASRPA